MSKRHSFAAALALCIMSSSLANAQAPARTPPPMSFFVTSVGIGDGGNLGGLAGADAQCQKLATAVGAGSKTWHAYLSTQGPGAVNARDRIGTGPWYNAKGAQIAKDLGDLHGDTLDQARMGNNITHLSTLNEKGELIKDVTDRGLAAKHDMLTGTQLDGRAYTDAADHTCKNWTSDSGGNAQLGHDDRVGGGRTSWNSAHASDGCSQPELVKTGGVGLFYCFAIN